jgi:hypothetical protein
MKQMNDNEVKGPTATESPTNMTLELSIEGQVGAEEHVGI